MRRTGRDRLLTPGQTQEVPYGTESGELLARHPEIDVVCILTPTELHAADYRQAVPTGCHVALEKTMALTLTDPEAMIRDCDAAKEVYLMFRPRFSRLGVG